MITPPPLIYILCNSLYLLPLFNHVLPNYNRQKKQPQRSGFASVAGIYKMYIWKAVLTRFMPSVNRPSDLRLYCRILFTLLLSLYLDTQIISQNACSELLLSLPNTYTCRAACPMPISNFTALILYVKWTVTVLLYYSLYETGFRNYWVYYTGNLCYNFDKNKSHVNLNKIKGV